MLQLQMKDQIRNYVQTLDIVLHSQLFHVDEVAQLRGEDAIQRGLAQVPVRPGKKSTISAPCPKEVKAQGEARLHQLLGFAYDTQRGACSSAASFGDWDIASLASLLALDENAVSRTQ